MGSFLLGKKLSYVLNKDFQQRILYVLGENIGDAELLRVLCSSSIRKSAYACMLIKQVENQRDCRGYFLNY